MILVIDNYDSFVHNLARYFRLEGAETTIVRNDVSTVDALLAVEPQAVVLSPGPKAPADAGLCLELLQKLPLSTPLLGVCLGHQCLGEFFGGKTLPADRPLHGQASTIRHNEAGIFQGLPSPLQAGRYHSLISVMPENSLLKPCAWSEEGEIMAVQHEVAPWFGVQFHPESILTPYGRAMVRNFLAMA